MPKDWFRNESWSPEIAAHFQLKLKRCRTQGPQSLYIQALTLAKSEPHIALGLIAQYFSTGDLFFTADALFAQAQAYSALEETDKAIESYEQALAWEADHPNMLTTSHLDLPYLIATSRCRDHYQRAIDLLQSPKAAYRQLVFPIELFKYAASLAFLHSDLGDKNLAKEFAKKALEAAQTESSQFPRHKNAGLVGPEFQSAIRELSGLANGNPDLCSRMRSLISKRI